MVFIVYLWILIIPAFAITFILLSRNMYVVPPEILWATCWWFMALGTRNSCQL